MRTDLDTLLLRIAVVTIAEGKGQTNAGWNYLPSTNKNYARLYINDSRYFLKNAILKK